MPGPPVPTRSYEIAIQVRVGTALRAFAHPTDCKIGNDPQSRNAALAKKMSDPSLCFGGFCPDNGHFSSYCTCEKLSGSSVPLRFLIMSPLTMIHLPCSFLNVQ